MKKLSLIVCILSLFSLTAAFAEGDTDSPSGSDLCADDRQIVDKSSDETKIQESKGTAAETK